MTRYMGMKHLMHNEKIIPCVNCNSYGIGVIVVYHCMCILGVE